MKLMLMVIITGLVGCKAGYQIGGKKKNNPAPPSGVTEPVQDDSKNPDERSKPNEYRGQGIVLTANPGSVRTNQDVTFTAKCSETNTETVTWHFDDGLSETKEASATVIHQYSAAKPEGYYPTGICTFADGRTVSANLKVIVTSSASSNQSGKGQSSGQNK